MIKSIAIVWRTVFAVLMAVLLQAAMHARGAECPGGGSGFCHPDFTLLTAVAPHPAGGFVAVGILGPNTGKSNRVGLLRIDQSGDGQYWTEISPPKQFETFTLRAEEITALGDGSFVFLGRANAGESQGDDVVEAWVALVGPAGETIWSRAVPNPSRRQQILYRATRLRNSLVVAVGRAQTGKGDPTCQKQSRGLLVWIDTANPNAIERKEVTYVPQANRMAFYDVVEGLEDGSLILTGFESRKTGRERRCQDDILVLRTDADGVPDMRSRQWIGGRDSQEIAYALENGPDAAEGRAVVGIRYPVGNSGRRAAVVARGGWSSLASDGGRKREISVGSGGTDRFVAAIRIPGTDQTVVGGYYSEGARDRHKAWWHTLDSDLESVSEDRNRIHAGSSIRDMAIAADTSILAVGSVVDGQGRNAPRFGWSHVVRLGKRFRLSGRERDPTLPALPIHDGVAEIGTLGTTVRAFAGSEMVKGLRIRVRFDVGKAAVVRLALQPFGGDADLVLTREGGALVDFSNHTGEAGELVEANLEPGRYIATISVAQDMDAVELRAVALADSGTAGAGAPRMSVGERLRIARMLELSGYHVGGDPEIGLGGRMFRSVQAAAISGGAPLTSSFKQADIQALLGILE